MPVHTFHRRLLLAGAVVLTASANLLPAQTRPAVRLTYLGNMGVLLEAGEQRVVVDALHRGELPDYAHLPPDLLAELEGATGRLKRIDVALTTHRHLDHFAAASVAARLRSDSAFHYLAPTQVVDTLRALAAGWFRTRVHPVTPPAGGRAELQLAGIRIAALDLPHQRVRRSAQNLGYLIRLGGLTILHVGDADRDPARFARHRLAAERIDVAIIPSWYLSQAPETIRREIAARTVVVSHITPSDTAKVRREVTRDWPGAIVLARPGEQFSLGR